MKNLLSKKNLIIGAVIFAVMIGGVGWWYVASRNVGSDSQVSEVVAQEQEDETIVSYAAVAGKNVLEQLQELNDTVVTQESTYGTYVDSINGLKGGDNGAYWIFFIDGEMASVGAGAYIAEGGELIEWKYQSE